MMKNIMKRAHKLAKGMEGDYTARLVIALRQAWKEEKNYLETIARKVEETALRDEMVHIKANVWEKHGKKRIYFNQKGESIGYFEFNGNNEYVKGYISRKDFNYGKALSHLEACQWFLSNGYAV